MELKEVVKKRRAYRSLQAVEITTALVHDLAEHASLAPSCFNNQPWRFVFTFKQETLDKLFTALSKGNAWAHQAAMIIAVISQKELDCVVKGREYYQFDSGMAAAFLMLRAADLDLVCHPIAGYDEEKVKEILDVPENMTVITLLIVGKKSDEITPALSEKQVESEKHRPKRLNFPGFAFIDKYGSE